MIIYIAILAPFISITVIIIAKMMLGESDNKNATQQELDIAVKKIAAANPNDIHKGVNHISLRRSIRKLR